MSCNSHEESKATWGTTPSMFARNATVRLTRYIVCWNELAALPLNRPLQPGFNFALKGWV